MSKNKAKHNRQRRNRQSRQERSARSVLKRQSAYICWDCGATNDPGASECWLCHRRNWRADAASPASRSVATTSERAGLTWIHSVDSVVIVLALAVVESGVAMVAPGLGIILLILLIPAWVITEWRARRRDTPMSAPRKLAWIVVATVLIPVVLALSPLIAFFAICTAAIM
jgi:ribosomal protein L40E